MMQLEHSLPHQGTPSIAARVIPFIIENFADEISLEDLAAQAGLSKFRFCRRFQAECGVTPVRWLWHFRVLLSKEFIAMDPKWSLTDVAFACGFTSSAHFSRMFRRAFATSPTAFKTKAMAKNHSVRQSLCLDTLFSIPVAQLTRVATSALVGSTGGALALAH